MANYVFVYYDGESPAPVAPSEEQKTAWGNWFQSLGDKIVDGGAPFMPNGKEVASGGVNAVSQWPAMGYTVVKASSIDEAAGMAKSCPILESDTGSVRVYESMPM